MIPTQVIKRMGMEKARKQKAVKMMAEFVDNMEEISWGDNAMQEEQRSDSPFVAMSNEEFVAYLNTEEGKKMKGLDMIRINLKRMSRIRAESTEPEEEAPKTPQYWYNEYTRYPHLYFSSEAEQKEAIAEVVQEWSIGTGRWRFALMNDAAKKIQQTWIAKRVTVPRTCKTCLRVALGTGTQCLGCALPSFQAFHPGPCEVCGKAPAVGFDKLKSSACQKCIDGACGGACEVCKKEPVTYMDKYESAVCANCMNGICKRCKVYEATPESETDECMNCYYRNRYETDLEDALEQEREQQRQDWIDSRH